jgi:uncharacterized protein YcbK (DUF882 family)
MFWDKQWNRREILSGGAVTAAGLLLPDIACAGHSKKLAADNRTLSFRHIHTGAKGTFTYWENGRLLPQEMKAIAHFLRDIRTGEVHPIDQSLLDQLYLLHYFTESNRPFEVISGYRSPKTNAMLYRSTKGVDKNSFHLQGRAIDIRLGDVRLHHLNKAALDLQAGGVGYYPHSNFIHLDSGAPRHWVFQG